MRLKLIISVGFWASLVFLNGCYASHSTDDSSQSGDPRIIYYDSSTKVLTTSNFTLTLSATVLPPTINGITLAANDVTVSGTNAYVSYNLPGANHIGAIDVLSFLVPTLPTRTASMTNATETINGAAPLNGTIYTVGASNTTQSSGWPAVGSTISFSGSTLTKTNEFPLLQTYTGTGVKVWQNLIYTISGGGGSSVTQGLSVSDPTSLASLASINIVEPRALSYYPGGGTDLFVVSGNNGNGGQLIDINTSNAIAHTVNIGGNVTPESKSTVQVGKTMVAVSKSEGGFAIVCQADQAILATVPAPTGVAGLTNAQTVTNAVTIGPGLAFAANGNAGVYVYKMVSSTHTVSSCSNVTLTYIGTLNFGSTTYSANNVSYVGGSLFVATGLGGFNVVTVTVLSPLLGGTTDFL